MTFQHLLSKCGDSKLFLSYRSICVPLQEYYVLVDDYGFDIHFANLTQNNKLNNVDVDIGMYIHFGYIG